MRIREGVCHTQSPEPVPGAGAQTRFPQGSRLTSALMESKRIQLDYLELPSATRALTSSHIRFPEGPLGFGHWFPIIPIAGWSHVIAVTGHHRPALFLPGLFPPCQDCPFLNLSVSSFQAVSGGPSSEARVP